MPIQRLPDHVVNQIAAGEVVERPLSVVRELLDNALDASATEIRIEIENGGRNLIKVTDNGCGMSSTELEKAFERHATSKLRTLDDLKVIRTLGFRGEALAAIASVSVVRARSREQESHTGTEFAIDAGTITERRSVAAPAGTEIEVRRLFFNTPARRKFLKSERTEEQRIKQWVAQVSLAHPKVHFRLVADQKEILSLSARADLMGRARQVAKEASLLVSLTVNSVTVNGIVSHPDNSQHDASSLTVLVNGRVVSDRTIVRAARDGYEGILRSHEYPAGVLSIEIAPELVDVNVHPQKSEVRFAQGQSIYVAVREAVRVALRDLRTGVRFPQGSSMSAPAGEAAVSRTPPFPVRSTGSLPSPEAVTMPPASGQAALQFFEETARPAEAAGIPAISYRVLRYAGQIFDCYLLCEHEGQLVIVDMHAAHERINFNRIRGKLASGGLASQRLLVPAEITLSDRGIVRVESERDALERCGFEFATSENGTVRVSGAPGILSGPRVSEIFRDVAGLHEDASGTSALDVRLDHIAARLACHASVRSGQRLSPEEAYALLETLDRTESAGICPHGRPIAVHVSRAELEGWFGRLR